MRDEAVKLKDSDNSEASDGEALTGEQPVRRREINAVSGADE
ncbi:hypothetical protein SIN_01162 [Salmonella enterica subsp. enterica serovar Infantis]|uniref:Uncharacterized protein n=1 Tax=Salmonella enterica subsp. enterica serovar Sanjuan TaxID=1160765 RepID=A0A3S4IX76_SALET|nr:hypothetical protein SIN_01162 [Salmonella enterica subsp. enterica serovar Infantis]VEA07596.1 Uncharacterised protein [Salmonella enterica subsp. enterica serovar Sanjuan]VEA12621.1 Uncharacterised protein [Salmonella enterica subsp. enterica]